MLQWHFIIIKKLFIKECSLFRVQFRQVSLCMVISTYSSLEYLRLIIILDSVFNCLPMENNIFIFNIFLTKYWLFELKLHEWSSKYNPHFMLPIIVSDLLTYSNIFFLEMTGTWSIWKNIFKDCSLKTYLCGLKLADSEFKKYIKI